MELIESYPEFREMYGDIYDLCLNTEKVMEMFSKELLEMDKNTVLYMIDEMQNEIDEQKVMLQDKDAQLQQKDVQLLEKEQNLEYERAENERLRALLKQAQVPVE